MKLNTLFIIIVILGLFFGIVFMLMPGGAEEFYGADYTEAGKVDLQLLGASFLGFAVLLFLATKSKDAVARKAIVLGLFVSFVIALVISLKAQLAGVFNVWGWSKVAIFGIVSIFLLIFLIKGVE